MPAAVAAVVAYYSTMTLSSFIIGTLVSMATSFVLGGLESLIAGKPRGGGVSPGGITSQEKQPITSRKPVYGEIRLSGPILFAASSRRTGDVPNTYLHYIIALAPHELQEIGEIWIDDYPIPNDAIDPITGVVTSGRYGANPYLLRIVKHLGTPGQVADALLTADYPVWTSDHSLQGIAYIYIRLGFNTSVYPSGIPNISAFVKGKKIYDPRTATTAYSTNMALIVNDYLMDSTYGLGATTAEIDQTYLTAAANTCDEFVTVTDIPAVVSSVDPVTDIITLTGERLEIQTGDKVQATTTGTLPAGLALLTDYYVITYQRKTSSRILLATSYANAMAGTAINITDAGSGTHTITKKAEPRYSGAIQVDSDVAIGDNINNILTGMAGKVVYSGGSYRIFAGAYQTPTVYFSEKDFAGAITVQTKVSKRERFNSVHGIYLSPLNDGIPADYPPVSNSFYQTQDNGELIIKQLDFPATSRAHTAQRLAKIELEKSRQEITFSADFNLAGMLVGAGDTAFFSISRFGWTNKIFEIADWKLDTRDQNGVPLPVVNMTLRETASAVFDWNNGEETKVDISPNTDLPNPYDVTAPGAPQVVEALYVTNNGNGVKNKATLTSVASVSDFVTQYQFKYKLLTDTDYITRAPVSGPTDTIFDIAPGTYDFEARAINILGGMSDWQPNSPVEITGLLAAPSPLTGLTIQAISSLAVLNWVQATDLDVLIGGTIAFRWSPASSGADWTQSTSIGDSVAGSATSVILPLKAGTYLARPYDSSGIPGDVITVYTAAAVITPLSTLTSLTENPLFLGTFSGACYDPDPSPAIIKLSGSALFDTITDVDALTSFDYTGGVGTSGTYNYYTYIDLTTVQTVRLLSHIMARTVAVLDLFDSRSNNIDDWLDFDGANTGDGDCTVWVASTSDDPAGSPTWSDWQRLDVGEYTARAFKFQARLTTIDPIYNIYVQELSITVQH